MDRSIWPNWREERPYAALVIGGLLILFLLGVAKLQNLAAEYAFIGKAPQYTSINITGEGREVSVPDVATVDLGLLTTSAKVADAQAENTKKMNQLTDRLKALSIADRDLKTANYSIYPHYDYKEGASTVSGYDVSQTLNVKIRDLNKLATVLQIAGEIGSNQIGGLNFTVDDREVLRERARQKALANALQKARALSASTGLRLGKLISYNESEVTPEQPQYFSRDAGLGAGGGGAAPSVQSGSLEIVSSVSLTFETK